MIKGIFVSALVFTMFTFTSCEKCATCESTVSDPQAEDFGEPLVSEFCERGKVFDDQLETYEAQDWDCEVE